MQKSFQTSHSIPLFCKNAQLKIELIDKLFVRRGFDNHADKIFGCFGIVCVGQNLANAPSAFQFARSKEQFFLSRAALCKVDCRENSLFAKSAIEMDFHIARAFEFFKDNVVHTTARIDKRGCYDRERATVFDISCRAEETLGTVQSTRIYTT